MDHDIIAVTTKHPTKKVMGNVPTKLHATARALSGAIEAEKWVASDVIWIVGVKEVPTTEEFPVVVAGVGSLAYVFIGNTAADTGGGMMDAVMTLSGGTAMSCLSIVGGDWTDEVTT